MQRDKHGDAALVRCISAAVISFKDSQNSYCTNVSCVRELSHVGNHQCCVFMVSTVSCFSLGVVFFFWLHFYLLPFFSSLLSWFSTQPRFHLFLFFFLPVLPYFLISPLCVSFHSVIVGSSVHHTESFACVFSNLYFQLSPIPLTNWNILQPACNALTISVSPLKSLSCFTRCLSASLVACIWIC